MKRIESKGAPSRATPVSIRVVLGLLGLATLGFADPSPVRAAGRVISSGLWPGPAAENAVVTGGIRVIATPCEYGYIDRVGKALPLPKAKFVHLCRFQEGLAAVEIDLPGDRSWGPEHWGFINQEGRLVIPPGLQYA